MDEVIRKKKERLAALEARIKRDQAQAVKLRKAIEDRENESMLKAIKEIDMPISELKVYLEELKRSKV